MRFGCQLDEPHGFSDDHWEVQQCFNVFTDIYKMCFTGIVPLLYSVGDKTTTTTATTTTTTTICDIRYFIRPLITKIVFYMFHQASFAKICYGLSRSVWFEWHVKEESEELHTFAAVLLSILAISLSRYDNGTVFYPLLHRQYSISEVSLLSGFDVGR